MPAVPDYHPEFGLLCPSPRRRRGMRLAALCVMTAMAIGATMGLAVARWPASGDGLAAASEPSNSSPLARVSATGGVTPPGHKSCKPEKVDSFPDLLALFLAPDCGSGNHVRHGAREANRAANIIIGRTDATPTTETAAQPVEVKASDVEKASNAATAAVEPTKLPKKPKLKPRDPGRQNAMLNPYGGPRFGHESYDPYRNPYRATGGQSGFEFGRSW